MAWPHPTAPHPKVARQYLIYISVEHGRDIHNEKQKIKEGQTTNNTQERKKVKEKEAHLDT